MHSRSQIEAAPPIRGSPFPGALEWCASADIAKEIMRYSRVAQLPVSYRDQVIGYVHLEDVMAMEGHGAWLGSILVRDVMRRWSDGHSGLASLW